MKHTFRIGAFAIIRDDQGRVLLGYRRDCDYWGLPGGGVEAGETPWQGVVREVCEETGLDVLVERLTGVYCWPHKNDLIFVFACTVAGGALATSDETREVRFFPPDALPTNTFTEHARRVSDGMDGLPTVALRVPAGPSATEERQRGER